MRKGRMPKRDINSNISFKMNGENEVRNMLIDRMK